MQTKYLYINTIGCQMNVYDSEKIAVVLQPLGYELTRNVETADLIIVNTCAIRAKAEQKAFSFLGRMAGLKRKRPDLIIGMGGCVAQQEGRTILERMPFVDLVFGTHVIGRLPEMVARIEQERCHL
ncbi:MAG: tRNA (N6-isopentenyl adenosine(37)-C2)-methylthiotransferase MiaB, partial [Deltaproteobacteria bacterium]